MNIRIKINKVGIRTEYITLDGFLKFSGVAVSGGEAKKLIFEKKVLVNGKICVTRGKKLRKGDRVSVLGKNFEVCDESNFA